MNQEKTSARSKDGRKIRNDVILIAAILTVIALAILAFFMFRAVGDSVVVTLDGKLYGEYSLDSDVEVLIKHGEGYNVLVIKDGAAYIESASCPDGICSSHRPIRYKGESIICLPNKVVVEVRSQGNDQSDQPDVIV